MIFYNGGHYSKILQSYSLWNGCNTDCSFLLKRLGLTPNLIIGDLYEIRSPDFNIRLDIRGQDALLALCNYCERCGKEDTLALRAVLTLFASAHNWTCYPNVEVYKLITRSVQVILKASSNCLSAAKQEKVISILMGSLMKWSQLFEDARDGDPQFIRVVICSSLESLLANIDILSDAQKSVFLRQLIPFLDGSAFDIRLLIADAPSDFRLEDVVKGHYAPTLTTLSIVKHLVTHNSGKDEDIDNIKRLSIDYFQCLISFLVNSLASEPFLCNIIEVLLGIYTKLGLLETEWEPVTSILLSIKFFKSPCNFALLFEPVSMSLSQYSMVHPDFAYQLIGAVKGVLFALNVRGECNDYPDRLSTFMSGGKILGKTLKSLLKLDRMFCESFVSNFGIEFPQSSNNERPTDGGSMMSSLAIIFGNMAIAVDDDAIAKICLSSLLTQFNKTSPQNLNDRQTFLSQFAIMATHCNGGPFNAIIDTLSDLIKSGIHPLETLNCLENISQSILNDPVKKDVLLVTLLRLFIDKGMLIVGGRDKKKSCGDISDLDLILRAISNSLDTFTIYETSSKQLYVELFQEFWLLLVYLGYQDELNWRQEWTPYIPSIARHSPVLIKERDKLQSPGSTFSQLILAQSINPSLRNYMVKFFPNSAPTVRNLTFAQSLWLIAIYYTEINKVRAEFFDHFCIYLKSDIIILLGIQNIVEEMVSSIVFDWRKERGKVGESDIRLARALAVCLGHSQAKTHQACLKILQNYFITEEAIYTDPDLWKILVEKLRILFFVCRSELYSPEMSTVPDEVTRDPINARSAFKDLVILTRQIFGAASKRAPNSFFRFAHTKLFSSNDTYGLVQGDRDIAIMEFLRIIHSSNAPTEAPESYLTTEALIYRNAEDFVNFDPDLMTSGRQSPSKILQMITTVKDPDRVRKGLRLWLAQSNGCPTFCKIVLIKLTSEIPSLFNTFKGSHPNPLRSKLTGMSTPAEQLETKTIASFCVIFDFISEILQYDITSNSDYISLYLSFVDLTLANIKNLPRILAFRVFVLAFEVFNLMASNSVLKDILLEHLFRVMIEYISDLPQFLVSNKDCVGEEIDLIRDLIDGIAIVANTNSDSIGKRLYPIACAIILILDAELRDTLVWLGNQKASEKPPSFRMTKLQVFEVIATVSSSLSRRFALCWKPNDLPNFIPDILSPTASSELITFAVEKNLRLSTETLIFCAPLMLPTSISVFRHPLLRKDPEFLNLAMRSLEQSPPDVLFFYIPQLVQSLRHDDLGYIERSILHIAKASSLFAHQIIWNMKANSYVDEAGTQPDILKPSLDAIISKIINQFSNQAKEFYEREFSFFEKVTNISGALKPYVKKEKWEKKAKIDEELAKVVVDVGVYLPSNSEYQVVDIDYDSGRPLQSHAKAPFMATFKVKPSDVSDGSSSWQSVIFKVGDDCRQDVLALQLISLVKKLAESHHLPVYLFPYRVVATAPGCGVIEVIPKSISRDQLGREKINSLYEYFIFRFGGESSRAFHEARINFVRSMAAYSVVCYLLAIKDRHNGNIMIDDVGHVIHIDFGFILDIAPGGITFEKAPFKITAEMLQVMGGMDDSPYFKWFCELCVQTFLVCRCYSESFVQLVEAMSESGLPCFKGVKTIRNLRNRFRLDLDAQGARDYMYDLIYKSCESMTTGMYDYFQLRTNGIPY